VDEDREDTEEEDDDDEHGDIICAEVLNLGDDCTVNERLNTTIEK
jgi:hypothetical protein